MAADLLSQAEHGTDSQVVLVAINLTDKQLDVIQVHVTPLYQDPYGFRPKGNVAVLDFVSVFLSIAVFFSMGTLLRGYSSSPVPLFFFRVLSE